MTIEEKLNEIEERANKATEGPWFEQVPADCVLSNRNQYICYPPNRRFLREPENKEIDSWNATFIAKARTDIPKLLAALREALEECDFCSCGSADDDKDFKDKIQSILEGKNETA